MRKEIRKIIRHYIFRSSKRWLFILGPFDLHKKERGDDQEQDAIAQSQEYPLQPETLGDEAAKA
jgi:hypothetical protein